PLAGLQPAGVLKHDPDRRAVLLHPAVHEIARDHGGDQRHEPHEVGAPPPPAPDARDGRGFGRGSIVGDVVHDRVSGGSQISLGSKLTEAMIVSTATAVNEKSPRPGSTVASSPSFTRAPSTA